MSLERKRNGVNSHLGFLAVDGNRRAGKTGLGREGSSRGNKGNESKGGLHFDILEILTKSKFCDTTGYRTIFFLSSCSWALLEVRVLVSHE